MAELVTTIAAKLIEVLGLEIINKVFELWGYKSELEELKETVSTVKMVLLDADAKWDHLSNQEQDFIRKLKDVVYDADDVFDEVLTLAQLNLLDGPLKKPHKILRKVSRFFSSKNQVGEAYRMSCEVKTIKKRLDAIASDRAKFNLDVDFRPISRRPKETCSYVDVNDIIGRDKDKEVLIDMLLDPNVASANPCVLAIVGVGGLGKTVLAQLVFEDEKIKQEFSDATFRLWVCVSDQEGEQFDDKVILCKILELVGEKLDYNSSKQYIQMKFQEAIRGKKFLLVLDDVWNENREKWLDLENFLRMGQGGSRVIVTTRSEVTATVIGSSHIYKIEGLSPEYSQRLFEMSAFGQGCVSKSHSELIEIGKKIVEKCYRVPLALKVAGSLLYGQDIKKWRSIQESGLAKIGDGDNRVLSILKLSYHNLEPSLKSCFTYCAVFPKDYEIEKEKIISLWLAQGYVVPFDRDQSLEDAAEEHFTILLRRCFFQDVKIDEFGDVKSVKIHDLMHDVAQEVGKEEICIVTSMTHSIGDKIRHVYVGDGTFENSNDNKKIRSYFNHPICVTDAQITIWMHVRVLSLRDCTNLPNSFRKLQHLRYLDLSSNNSVEVLGESITELYNLQTLNLSGCKNLRELPEGIGKLVNLRHLYLYECSSLTSMPLGLVKLTNLRFLPLFVVGYKSITKQKESGEVMLKDLKALNKMQGDLSIRIGENIRNVLDTNDYGGYLKSKVYLRELEILFRLRYDSEESEDTEAMMEKLDPPPNLKKLILIFYNGKRIGRWGREEVNWAISLPFLVRIDIRWCMNLKELPMLSKLPHLKSLNLEDLNSLEYMEIRMSSSSSDSETDLSTTQFFPSLERLRISNLPRLKGWWKGEMGLSLIFPRLSDLSIDSCPYLAVNLICPSLKICRCGNSERLQITCGTVQDDAIKLRTFTVNQVGHIKLLPTNAEINKVESSASSLNVLYIQTNYSSKLPEEMSICDKCEVPTKSCHYSLRHLDLHALPAWRNLPKQMEHFSLQSHNFQFLSIDDCPNIKLLQQSSKNLSYLKNILCPPTTTRRTTTYIRPDLQKICYETQWRRLLQNPTHTEHCIGGTNNCPG